MPDIKSCIDHIKTAVDVDPWAADMAEKALKKEIPQKWVRDIPYRVSCPVCGIIMNLSSAIVVYRYCYNCGQKCEGMDREDDDD